MSKFKLNNVALVIEQIALSGLDFIKAAGAAGDEVIQVQRRDLLLSQVEVAAMLAKALMQAVEKDEAAIAASVPNPLLN